MKFRAALLTLVLASTTLAISPALSAPLTIGIAYDIGGRGDRSFNDAAAIGLEKAKKKFEFTVEAIVTDGTSIDRERRVRSLIAKNCNPVIAVGSGYAPTIKTLAAEFPDTQFAILNDATIEALNVSSLIFSDTQAAYLAGYSAALASKSGKVAMIASSTQADMFHDGFSAGVKAAKKSVTSIIRYVNGSSTAASKLAMDAGADVLFIARPGSNSEIFSQIANRNKAKSKSKGYKQVGMISIEPDQYVTMTTSNRQFLYATVVKHVDKAIYDVITLAISGRQYLDILDAERGIYGHRYNVSDGGITFKTYLPALASANSLINGAAAQASKIAA